MLKWFCLGVVVLALRVGDVVIRGSKKGKE